MQYLGLVYLDADHLAALTGGERDALACAIRAYDDALRRHGHHLASYALECAPAVATVRVRAGRLDVSDRPAVATREQVAALYLIEARDLNEAIRLASHHPSARLGSIELRPVNGATRRHFDH